MTVWYGGHLHRVTYTRGRIDTIDSPDDKHMVAWNMQRIGINKYIWKRTVHHVGYLQRLHDPFWSLRTFCQILPLSCDKTDKLSIVLNMMLQLSWKMHECRLSTVIIYFIGMCRMWQFLAVFRSFFPSSPLCTFSCHPSPPTILSSLLLAVGPVKVSNPCYGWGNQPFLQHGSPSRKSKGVWWTRS